MNEILSVTAFVSLLNQTLEFAYPLVVVEGEVSGFKINQNKWVFFDLKDGESSVSCFMSKYQLKVAIEDGMLIRVSASPKLTNWGKFSLTVRDIELSGEGAVKKAFEIMKAQLEQEGLFAPERKRVLEPYPSRVALITSAQAAAYNDFLTIITKRWPYLVIDHRQVLVQGTQAPAQIVAAIRDFNESDKGYDCLVVIRGGGSAEDLQAFNHEDVVRAVYGSKIPTLVAIGHEDDVVLAELAADVRGATPTDAAQRLTPEVGEVKNNLIHQCEYLQRSMAKRINDSFAQLAQFYSVLDTILRSAHYALSDNVNKLSTNLYKVYQQHYELYQAHNKLLRSLNPERILNRGYSIATINGEVITDAVRIQIDDDVMLQLSRGKALLRRKK